METKEDISRLREQVAVLTAAERLGKMRAPHHSPGVWLGRIWARNLSSHTSTLLASSVRGVWRIIYPESGRKIYGFMGPKNHGTQTLFSYC